MSIIDTLYEDHMLRILQSQGYFPDWDIKVETSTWSQDLAAGEAGENEVINFLSESKDSFTLEVKTDQRAGETGNVYIELMSKGKPSGVMATQATWFVILAGETMLTFKTSAFKKFVNHIATKCEESDDNRYGEYRLAGTNTDPQNPTKGLVANLGWLVADFTVFNNL